jgi:fatty acid desaturase
MAAPMEVGLTKKQAAMASVLPADEWKNYNNMTSDVQGFIQLAFHATCAAIPMCGVHYARQTGSLPLLIISELVLGFVASFYFAGLHEILHMTAFRSKWISVALSYPVGFGVFRAPNWFWCFHWNHHRYTQDPERDPEMSGGTSDRMDPSKSIFAYAFFMTGYPFGFERVVNMAKLKNSKDNWVVVSGMEKVVFIENVIFITLYALIAMGSVLDSQVREVVTWYWLLPHIIGASHLRFYQFCEHRGCEMGDHVDLDAWGSCRTTKTFWWYARLAWNMPFHIEHHSWPAVPFYLLPALHERIKDTQPETRALFPGEDGYFAVHKEFLRRVWYGLPTSIPLIPHQEDSEAKAAATEALERRRAAMVSMANDLDVFDMSEVVKHDNIDNCWVVIDGMVIDATSFIPVHPGGKTILAEKAGKDVSRIFKMVHPEGTLETHLPERCIVGVLATADGKKASSEGALTKPLLTA